MKRKFIPFIKYSLLAVILFFSTQIFLPRSYQVPEFHNRPGTKYWDLQTGSRIGYTLIAAKNQKKPYPIIYLHGGPGGYITNRVIGSLAPLSDDGYDVYLYDQVGGGQSDRLANIAEYTIDRHIRDLDEIIKKTGAEKVILLGQSWGAILSVLYIARHPEKVDKIIFTGPGPIFPVHRELENIKAPDSLHLNEPYFSNKQGYVKANNLRTKAMSYWATTWKKKMAPDKEADDFETYLNAEVNKSTVCDTAKIVRAEAGGGFYARVMTFRSLFQVPDPRPKVKNLQLPVLIMKGQCDNQEWGFTKEYLDLFTNHQLHIIPNAGHFLDVEQPAMYIKIIREFLER